MMRFLAISRSLGALAVVGILSAGAAPAQDARLAVVGEGRVAVVPDMAVLNLGVEARDVTAAGALAQVAQTLEAVMAVLDAAGIAPADRQSSGVFVQPIYEQGPRPDGPPVQTGLSASSDLSVRVRDVTTLGALLDDVASAGGNRFSGLSWDVQDRRPLLDAARRAAVADGQAKAKLYADAAGVQLGQIVQMAEDGADPAPMAMMEAASLRSMPMAAGEIEIAARLRMVFSLGE
jgi:hypothetical protein